MKDELESLYGVSVNSKKKTLTSSTSTRKYRTETYHESLHFCKSMGEETLMNNPPEHQNNQIVSETASINSQLSRATKSIRKPDISEFLYPSQTEERKS